MLEKLKSLLKSWGFDLNDEQLQELDNTAEDVTDSTNTENEENVDTNTTDSSTDTSTTESVEENTATTDTTTDETTETVETEVEATVDKDTEIANLKAQIKALKITNIATDCLDSDILGKLLIDVDEKDIETTVNTFRKEKPFLFKQPEKLEGFSPADNTEVDGVMSAFLALNPDLNIN